MRVISISSIISLFRYEALDQGVIRDADRLMLVYGERAYETAGVYSWREDVGLLFTQKPGHWHRVKLELDGRIGQDNHAVECRSGPEPFPR